MKEVKRIFMDRDGLSEEEAEQEVECISSEIQEMLADGCSYDEVEDLLLDYELEMDYPFDFL